MNRIVLLAASLLSILMPQTARAAAPGCSTASLAGGFGATARGHLLDGTAVLGVYRLSFDGKGALVVKGTISIGGVITRDVDRAGHYTLGANCSGSITMDGPQGEGFPSGFLVVEDNINSLRIVGTRPSFVVELSGRRQFVREKVRTCTTADLVGTFGSTGGGMIPGQGWVIGNGVMTFDGKGGMSLERSFNAAGQLLPDDRVVGTYAIGADCTGTLTYLPRNKLMVSGPPVHDLLIVDDDLNHFRIVGEDAGRTLAVDAQKQFPAAPAAR